MMGQPGPHKWATKEPLTLKYENVLVAVTESQVTVTVTAEGGKTVSTAISRTTGKVE